MPIANNNAVNLKTALLCRGVTHMALAENLTLSNRTYMVSTQFLLKAVMMKKIL